MNVSALQLVSFRCPSSSDVDESKTVPFVVPVVASVLHKANFTNWKIAYLYGPPQPLFVIKFFEDYLPFASESFGFDLISWDKALYFSIRVQQDKKKDLFVCVLFAIAALPALCTFSSLWFLKTSFLFVLKSLLWLVFCFSFFIRLIFFLLALWFLFSGYSVLPIFAMCIYVLYSDYVAYGRMKEPDELSDLRSKVISFMTGKGSYLSNLKRSYTAVFGVPVKTIKGKYYYDNGFQVGSRFFRIKPLIYFLELALFEKLDLGTNYVTTSGQPWNFVHPLVMLSGYSITMRQSLMVQDCILFIGKLLYIVTDPRSIRFAALAAEITSFRNTSCGCAMSEQAFDYFKVVTGDLFKEIISDPPDKRIFRMGDYRPNYVVTAFSFSDLSSFLGGLEKTMRAQALKRILQMVAIMIALVSFCGQTGFSLEGMTRVTKAIKTQPFDDTVDLATQLVSLLKWLSDTGWHLFTFGATETFVVDAPGNWKKAAEDMLMTRKHANFTNILGTGLIDLEGNKVPLSVFRSRIVKLIKIDWKLVESTLRTSANKFVMSEFKSLHQQLVAFESEVQAKLLTQSYRAAPYGLAIVGGTSVGKSTITNLIFAYYSAMKSIEHLPEMIFSHPSFTEFWDTYCGQDYILFDDVGAVHPQSKTEDKALFDVLQVNNNAPYIVPMAQADDKGTQCVTAKLMIATSNQYDLGVTTIFATPEAVLRRFNLFIHMTVKPQFACRLGRLDPVRVSAFMQQYRIDSAQPGYVSLGFSERFPPFWNFDILEVTHYVTGNVLHRFDHQYTATIDLLEFIAANCRVHESNQDRVMASFDSLKSMKFCSICNKPDDICCCPKSPKTPLNPNAPAFQPTSGVNFEEDSGFLAFMLFGCVGALLVIILLVFQGFFTSVCYSAIVWLWTLFVYVCVISGIVQCARGIFVSRLEAEPFFSSVRLPLIVISQISRSVATSWHDLVKFGGTILVGGCSRSAVLKASMDYMYARIRRRFTQKNLIVLALLGALLALVATPVYRMFFQDAAWLTTAKTDEVPSGAIPAEVEDSHSAYYNPNPPQFTASDKSKCLSGKSADSYIENTLRRHTCMVSFYDAAGAHVGEVIGLAVAGNLVATAAHGALSGSAAPYYSSNELRAVRGTVKFISLANEEVCTKHDFSLSSGSFFVDRSQDFILIDVPSMPSRASLVEYFVETHDPLADLEKIRLLEPRRWNLVPSLGRVKKLVLPSIYSKGFLDSTVFSVQCEQSWGPGHSGSTLVAQGKKGTYILGFQSLGDRDSDYKSLVATFIGRSYIKNAIREVTKTPIRQFSGVSKGPVMDVDGQYAQSSIRPTPGCPLLHEKDELSETNYFFVCSLLRAGGKTKSAFSHPPYRGFFLERGYICNKEAPKFDWKSKRHYLTQVSKISSEIDMSIVETIVRVLSSHWVMSYREARELDLLRPLSLEEALNGNDSVTWIERMKYSTSAGHPWNKTKSQLLEVRDNGNYLSGVEYYLPPDLKSEFDDYFGSLIDGNPLNYPYKGTQKDEPISADKNATRGPRIFCAANMYVIIAGRMLFGSYIRIAQRNFWISWAAVGINASSVVWGWLWRWISFFGNHRIIAGDYSNFDQNMSPVFTRAAYAVLLNLMEKSGHFDSDLLSAARSWASEAINPSVLIDGDVYDIAGTNPSGNPLTVHINCIVNILFIMYVWVSVGNDVWMFFDYVRMITYGDDNLIAVHTDFSNFDYWVIHVELKRIGVLYTPADKSDPQSKKFDLPEDIAFLKRGFEVRDGYCYAPLDISSLAKTFTCWMSSDLDDRAHGLACLTSCWENAVHYRAEIRDKVHADILAACKELGWPTEFPPVHEIESRFRDAPYDRADVALAGMGLDARVSLGFWDPKCSLYSVGIDAQFIFNSLAAPIVEEIPKSIVLWLVLFIGHCENVYVPPNYILYAKLGGALAFAFNEIYLYKLPMFGFSYRMIPPFLMHLFVMWGPTFWHRVAYHSLFNFATICYLFISYSLACSVYGEGVLLQGCMHAVYNSMWEEILYYVRPYRNMFHGLAFSVVRMSYTLFQWWDHQSNLWIPIMHRLLDHGVPLGPGLMPLLDNRHEFDDDEGVEDTGHYDGFYLVDGPRESMLSLLQDGNLNPILPSGPQE